MARFTPKQKPAWRAIATSQVVRVSVSGIKKVNVAGFSGRSAQFAPCLLVRLLGRQRACIRYQFLPLESAVSLEGGLWMNLGNCQPIFSAMVAMTEYSPMRGLEFTSSTKRRRSGASR
jgi:hypothetical protein